MAFLIWITGLSGSGKSTLAQKVYQKIKSDYPSTIHLDGDSFRKITNQTSQYSYKDRLEIGLQIARMCKFLIDQKINVICSTISLFEKIHKFNRKNFIDYYEVFVDCDMKELIKRDKKKIYSKKPVKGIKDVVGLDIPYDKPRNYNLLVDNTLKSNLDKNVQMILDSFERRAKK